MPIARTPPSCWDGRAWLLNRLTGDTIPAGCMRLPCIECADGNMTRVRRAVCRAQPVQLVTITQVGNDWQTVRARMFRVAYRMRAAGQPLDWAWVVERNPRGTGHHVHGVRRGGWMEHDMLYWACRREGCGFPWLTPADREHDPGGYMFKYISKGIRLHSLADTLALNGKRLVHNTRGFWLNDHGTPCSFRDARRGDGTWSVVMHGDPRLEQRDAARAAEQRAYLRQARSGIEARIAEQNAHDAAIETARAAIPGTGILRPREPGWTLGPRARRGNSFAGWRASEAARRRRADAEARKAWWGSRHPGAKTQETPSDDANGRSDQSRSSRPPRNGGDQTPGATP